ncbi:MAG: S26 family signal peptidase [Ilumatobacteraceae bacterium]
MNVSILDKVWPWRLFITKSDAMRPMIFAGDLLVVRRAARDGVGYEAGDVIVYDSSHEKPSASVRRICTVLHPSDGTTHYVVRRDDDGHAVDSIVESSRVIGEVEARLVNVGRVVGGSVGRSKRSLSRLEPAPNARQTALPGGWSNVD